MATISVYYSSGAWMSNMAYNTTILRLFLKKSNKSTQILIQVVLNISPEVNLRVRQRFLGGSENENKKRQSGLTQGKQM